MLVPPRGSAPLRDPFPEPPTRETHPCGRRDPRQGPEHRPKAPDSEQRAGARQRGCPTRGPGGTRGPRSHQRPAVLGPAGACRPCNDTEILMAICTSDFVIRGSIRSVSNNAELQESIIAVSATRIHRQKFPLFQAGGRPGRPVGSIRTPLRCGVRPGPGSFLFTGWLHFGEAWLSCAPRYRDFQRIYRGAQRTHQNPCEFPVD
uniref:Meteorin, glial cell differentiation regulator n=1 Tax=Junco hyemalis TaxID=40217 RepID=A0A8C5JTW9_JUNHY